MEYKYLSELSRYEEVYYRSKLACEKKIQYYDQKEYVLFKIKHLRGVIDILYEYMTEKSPLFNIKEGNPK